MGFKEILDTAVTRERFRIDDCISIEEYLLERATTFYNSIKAKLDVRQLKAFRRSIVRNAFLIEPVNDQVTSTKVEVRWSNHLDGDVRFASYDTCFAILEKLLYKIANLPDDDFSIIKEFTDNTVVPYEMPIDYINRYATPIHTAENIDLFLDDTVRTCTRMRQFIRDTRRNPAAEVFKTILDDKVKVKTYLTDRAQTGDYKTNREKRWEAHPNSVQYALRRDCMRIETKLLLQIAMFEGCDRGLVASMQEAGLLPDSFSFVKCPITGDNIQYSEFANDALHPTHGRSAFQVGHLNPLKSSDTDGFYGHTADNISWISENGNRIQGSLSLNEVNELLRRIYSNRPELREQQENNEADYG